jgi:hypothetical protein
MEERFETCGRLFAHLNGTPTRIEGFQLHMSPRRQMRKTLSIVIDRARPRDQRSTCQSYPRKASGVQQTIEGWEPQFKVTRKNAHELMIPQRREPLMQIGASVKSGLPQCVG